MRTTHISRTTHYQLPSSRMTPKAMKLQFSHRGLSALFHMFLRTPMGCLVVTWTASGPGKRVRFQDLSTRLRPLYLANMPTIVCLGYTIQNFPTYRLGSLPPQLSTAPMLPTVKLPAHVPSTLLYLPASMAQLGRQTRYTKILATRVNNSKIQCRA